ncbi:hypothetical protein [Streptomyces antimycoticus]|uniref:hypothetical protein n=1 Tax=Streptomyces antimycoticus TaxID=68175 RepID=UPI0038644C63|nr:hypothetical protein OG751_03815 [Streptomyces antimycoticus]
METSTEYPMRVRLYGGRSTHAACELPISRSPETACDYSIDVTAANHWMPDTAAVTCRRCAKAMKKEN